MEGHFVVVKNIIVLTTTENLGIIGPSVLEIQVVKT